MDVNLAAEDENLAGGYPEILGVAYYDQEIISEISKRTSLSEQYVQAIVEHRPRFLSPSISDRAFMA